MANVSGRSTRVSRSRNTAAASGAEAAPGHADKPLHRDVRGTQLCLYDHPATRCIPHNCATGHSTGRAFRYGCSGSDGGRRRTSSVVTDLPVTPHDHAARATLGRRDAIGIPASQRPGLILRSRFVKVSVPASWSTLPVAHSGTGITGFTWLLSVSQRYSVRSSPVTNLLANEPARHAPGEACAYQPTRIGI